MSRADVIYLFVGVCLTLGSIGMIFGRKNIADIVAKSQERHFTPFAPGFWRRARPGFWLVFGIMCLVVGLCFLAQLLRP